MNSLDPWIDYIHSTRPMGRSDDQPLVRWKSSVVSLGGRFRLATLREALDGLPFSSARSRGGAFASSDDIRKLAAPVTSSTTRR